MAPALHSISTIISVAQQIANCGTHSTDLDVVAIGSDVPHDSQPHPRGAVLPCLPGGRLDGKHEIEHMPECDAHHHIRRSHKFGHTGIHRRKIHMHFMGKLTVALLQGTFSTVEWSAGVIAREGEAIL